MKKQRVQYLFAIMFIALSGASPALANDVSSLAEQRFDLVCELRGRVVADPNPVSHGNYPADVKSWRDTARFAIDLQAMKYCDLVGCARNGPKDLISVTSTMIVLEDKPGVKWTIRRRDGWSVERLIDMGRTSLVEGTCRKAKFSGLEWHLESGRVVQGASSRAN